LLAQKNVAIVFANLQKISFHFSEQYVDVGLLRYLRTVIIKGLKLIIDRTILIICNC